MLQTCSLFVKVNCYQKVYDRGSGIMWCLKSHIGNLVLSFIPSFKGGFSECLKLINLYQSMLSIP